MTHLAIVFAAAINATAISATALGQCDPYPIREIDLVGRVCNDACSYGDFIYAISRGDSSSPNNLTAIDVSDLDNIIVHQEVNTPTGVGRPSVILQHNGFLYVGTSTTNDGYVNLLTYDISTPSAPSLVDNYELKKRDAGEDTNVLGMEIHGDKCYIAGATSFEIVDLSASPPDASWLADYNPNANPQEIVDVAVFGQYAYLTSENSNNPVRVVQIDSQTHEITEESVLQPPDIGDPPYRIDRHHQFALFTSTKTNTHINESYFYLNTVDTFQQVNAIDQNQVQTTGKGLWMRNLHITEMGVVYVIDPGAHFYIYDIVDPNNPQFVVEILLEPSGIAHNVNAYNDHAVVTGSIGTDSRIWLVAMPGCPRCSEVDYVAPFGQLDLDDVAFYITAHSNQDPAADLAEPFGVFDLADINAFNAMFLAGCP